MKLFLIILLSAAWQDLKARSISRRFLVLAGGLGAGFCVYSGRDWKEIFCSMAVGIAILALSGVTDGRIGAGDGWFFVVSGLFLGFRENLTLIGSGLFFCGLYSLVLTAAAVYGGGSVRKLRIPFLPFLVPVGLWLIFLQDAGGI